MRPSGIIFVVVLSGLLVASSPKGRLGLAMRAIPVTQVVHIPLKTMDASELSDSQKADPVTLLVSRGAADELPEGPDAFDVLACGRPSMI